MGSSSTFTSPRSAAGLLLGHYLLGDAFSLADATALPFFERLVFSLGRFKDLDALADFPRTRAWYDGAMARPSAAATKRPDAALAALYETFLEVDYAFGGLNKN